MDEDVDKLFSYNTRQELNVKNWQLGCFNICLQVAILTYIILGVFIYGEGYLDFEQARGAIATHVRGDAVAVSIGKPGTRYFSAGEITYPGLENGNVFVATRQKVLRQRRGTCEDYMMPCSSDDQCTTSMGGRCSEKGFCIEPAWCPTEEVPEIYELEVGDLFIWVKSSIQFIRLAPERIYSTEDNHAYPERGVNLFSVRDLLMMCKPVPVRYEEISELGAAIEVQFIWNCNVGREACRPEVSARRLDVLFDPQNIGYAFNYAERVSEDERVLNEMQGVRIFLRTYGTGRKLSVILAVMKASTTWTVLSIGPIITDLVMLRAMRKYQRRYFARKYEESPNFNVYIKDLHKRNEERARREPPESADSRAHERDKAWRQRLDED